MICKIKKWDLTDAADLAAALSNKKVQDNLRDGLPYPYTKQDGVDYISAMLSADENETFAFAITADGRVVVTGYRYYSQSQVEQMLLIGRLKRYGFSLEEIGGFLACSKKQKLFAKLQQQKEKLRRQKGELELVISELSAHLQNYERTGDIMGYQKEYEIIVTETKERVVLAARQMMSVNDFGKYYGSLYERIAKDRITPDGMRGAVYHDKEFNHECSDIELIVGVRERDRADKVMPGCLCAMTVHRGPYSSLSDAYGALTAWIEENGYEWDGAPYDIYTKNQFDNLNPDEWETEVYFPVKKK